MAKQPNKPAEPKETVDKPAEPEAVVEAKAAEETPTVDELDSAAKSIMDVLGYKVNDEPAKTEEKPEETPPEKPEKPTQPETPETPEKPEKPEKAPEKAEKPKKVYRSAAPQVDVDAIADRVAERLRPKEQPPAKEQPKDDLVPEDRRYRQALQILAERPEYKDAVKEFDQFTVSAKAYKEKWEAENKGKIFDPDDDEHQEFYDANEPKIDDDDVLEAKIELRVREKDAERAAKERANQVATSAKERTKTVRKQIASKLFTSVDESLKDIDDIEKLAEKDPAAYVVLKGVLPNLQVLVTELDLLYDPNLGYSVQPDNPTHVALETYIRNAETNLARMPRNQIVLDGKQFATLEDYNRMSESQQARHWTIWHRPENIKLGLVADYAALAKHDLEKIRPKSDGSPKKDTAEMTDQTPAKPTVQSPVTPAAQPAKRTFPNTSGSNETVNTPATNGALSKTDAELITSKLFPALN